MAAGSISFDDREAKLGSPDDDAGGVGARGITVVITPASATRSVDRPA
jgi:hypothetical protein